MIKHLRSFSVLFFSLLTLCLSFGACAESLKSDLVTAHVFNQAPERNYSTNVDDVANAVSVAREHSVMVKSLDSSRTPEIVCPRLKDRCR